MKFNFAVRSIYPFRQRDTNKSFTSVGDHNKINTFIVIWHHDSPDMWKHKNENIILIVFSFYLHPRWNRSILKQTTIMKQFFSWKLISCSIISLFLLCFYKPRNVSVACGKCCHSHYYAEPLFPPFRLYIILQLISHLLSYMSTHLELFLSFCLSYKTSLYQTDFLF